MSPDKKETTTASLTCLPTTPRKTPSLQPDDDDDTADVAPLDVVSTSSPKSTNKKNKTSPATPRSSRCFDCEGCRTDACRHCYLCFRNVSGNSCVFRPCPNLSLRTLQTRKRMAKSLVLKEQQEGSSSSSSQHEILYESLYGENGWATRMMQAKRGKDVSISSAANLLLAMNNADAASGSEEEVPLVDDDSESIKLGKNKKTNGNVKRRAVASAVNDISNPGNNTASLLPASKTNAVTATSSSKKKRCSCQGCLIPRCGECWYCRNNRGGVTCAFRTCVDHKPSTLSLRYDLAVRAVNTTHQVARLQDLFEQVYGENSWTTRLMQSKGVAKKSDPSTFCHSRGTKRTAQTAGVETTTKKNRRSKSHCNDCEGCLFERCHLCAPCQRRAGGTTSCSFRLCSNYLYAVSTLKLHWRFAQEVDLTEGSLLSDRFEAVYGKEGWATQQIAREAGAAVVPPEETQASWARKLRITAVKTTRCDQCDGCRQPNCGVCSPCVGMGNGVTNCCFRPCQTMSNATLRYCRSVATETIRSLQDGRKMTKLLQSFDQLYGQEGLVAQWKQRRDKSEKPAHLVSTVDVGDRVYCIWPKNKVCSVVVSVFD